MKTKLYLCLLMAAVSSITVSAQTMSLADQFISYFNNYQKKELAMMTTSDFKFKNESSDEILNRYDFFTFYFDDSETLLSKYKIIKKTTQKDKTYYVVEEQSQFFKLLDVKFPKWNMTITTVEGEVDEVALTPTEGYDAYMTELKSKTEKFDAWMTEHYPKVDLEELTDPFLILEYLNKYVQSKGISLSGLQKYDESTGIPELLTDKDSKFDNMACVHQNKLTEAERTSFYPFNKAKKVLLISFTDKDKELNYYAETPRITDLAIAQSTKQLNKVDINRLTDIFYNYGYKKLEMTVRQKYDCPEFKNAIVFLDENDKPFEYIALSFDCGQIEFSSRKMNYGQECNTKREFLEVFFVSKGVDIFPQTLKKP
ncbi:hypothetical protein [Chryseobacterium vaccae]|uniref:hypothetical protein n=1 Tax=Chryseobacterium vaccae TaxID=2604424 RepID=UPI00129726E3|nr:hypothetical protein [Chryseobacterium vaccae]